MQRAVSALKVQATKALDALANATDSLADGVTLYEALKQHKLSYGLTTFCSTLQRWVHLPIPVVKKWNSGFFLQVAMTTNRTFFNGEKDILVQHVLDECKNQGYIENTALVRLACDLRDEFLTSIPVCQKRVRLRSLKFRTRWMKRFVTLHKNKLTKKCHPP